jgi:acetylornithine/succinyldiaminopimelate/putrescine aminotransferase
LFDDQGRAYLDFVSGIGVASLGHGHPALARAIGDQAATLAHTSNLYFHPLQASSRRGCRRSPASNARSSATAERKRTKPV